MKPKDLNKSRAGKPAAPAMNAAAAAFVSADKWLEHLEEEIEPTCLKTEADDLELVLKNSPEDLALRESLARVRAAVKTLGRVDLPESGHYYDELHSKIMAAIDNDIAMNGEPERTPVNKKSARRPILFSTMFGAVGMTMMIAILAFVGLHKQEPVSAGLTAEMAANREQAIEENFERKIAMVDSRSGAAFARDMGSFESEEDFLTETAAARLKQVSARQADEMIKSLKE